MVKKGDMVILGGGPAGMSCAMELSRAGIKTTIIEKQKKVGGLAKTLIFKEGKYVFRTDIGPHRFFSKNKHLYEFIEGLLKEKWILVERQTRQLIEGKFYDYPINAMQAFKNIGPIRAFSMGLSYLHAVFVYRILKKEIISFEDYIVANFGRKLGEFNMMNYTEKLWGIPCSKLHPDWARQRIKGLNLMSALLNALSPKKDSKGPKTLVSSFYYPLYGTGLIYETIANRIIKKGSKILTNSYPTIIFHKDGNITKMEVKINGKKKVLSPSKVITSIPVTILISLLSPRPPKSVIEAVNKLKWRSEVYLFITLNKKRITKDNWIYFPNKDIPFGRVAEMKNFSKEMSPKDKTSLFVEFFVTENDEIWNMDKKQLFNLTMRYIERLKLFKRDEVRAYYTLRYKHVYPVYDLNYKKHLDTIFNYLDQFKNLYCIGRPGRFQYTNQDHSIEMGIATARGIIEGKKYDLDGIGSEDEYFEKGMHKEVGQS